MKKLKNRLISITMICVIIMTSFVTLPHVKAASYTVYTANQSCRARYNPGTNSSPIMLDGYQVYVYADETVEYLGSDTGYFDGNNNALWYKVKFDSDARQFTGYILASCIDVNTYTYNDDSAFEQSISAFPESYKPYLRKLHAAHPNWEFVADYNKLDWSTSVNAESVIGWSSVSTGYPSLYLINSTYPSGIVIDGDSWYAACSDGVAYYMDPRNFLTEKYVFMFESSKYSESQDTSVANILKGTFMDSSFTENGVTKTYAEAFIEAGRATGVSSVFLASKAIQEIGTTQSAAVSGTVSGYEGYYNFYNIGATSGVDNYLKGLQRAKTEGWNGIQKAITGGAVFIGGAYVTEGQDTAYFEKFNVSSYTTHTVYNHQYMTNIIDPASYAARVYRNYKSDSSMMNKNYRFVIPVYNSMTASAFKLSRVDTIGGDTTNDSGDTTTISPATKVANAGYSLATGYLTNIALGTDASTIRNKLGTVLNSGWNSKMTGAMATGDIIGVDNATYTAVIYGDVAGDGSISIKDLLYIKKYLLGDISLGDANKKAADISKDNSVTIKDLLLLKKYLLGEYSITQ